MKLPDHWICLVHTTNVRKEISFHSNGLQKAGAKAVRHSRRPGAFARHKAFPPASHCRAASGHGWLDCGFHGNLEVDKGIVEKYERISS